MLHNITCVILAGGLARRMGNIDKATIVLDREPLLAHVLKRMRPQTDKIIINANGDPDRFEKWDLPVVGDTVPDFPGPLAGVLAAMEWVQIHDPETKWIVSLPVDTPFAPVDLITRLSQSVTDNKADLACAMSNGRAHPVVGFWPVELVENLRNALTRDGIRKVDLWTGQFNLVHTEFDTEPVDPFFNINRPDDIKQAERILKETG